MQPLALPPGEVFVVGSIKYDGASELNSVGYVIVINNDIIGIAFPTSKNVKKILAADAQAADPVYEHIVNEHIQEIPNDGHLIGLAHFIEDMYRKRALEAHLKVEQAKPDFDLQDAVSTFYENWEAEDHSAASVVNHWRQSFGIMVRQGGEFDRVYILHKEPDNLSGGDIAAYIAEQEEFTLETERPG